MSRRQIPVLFVIIIALVLLWQLQTQENVPPEVSEPGDDDPKIIEDQSVEEEPKDEPLDEPEEYPEFNIMPVKHGSVKPPLHYNPYFSQIILEIESSFINGTIERRLAPLFDVDGPVILNGELQYQKALSIVDATGNTYILLSDKDQVIYDPVDDSTKLGWNPVDYYDGFDRIFIDGYKFEHSIEDETYTFLRPYWMGDDEKFQLIRKAHQIISDRISAEYTRKYFTVAPGYYGYQTNIDPDSDWRYGVMFNYDIQIGDYFQQLDVSIHFDKNKEFISGGRIPHLDNLQPFNVTQIQAIMYGVEAGLPSDAHTYEARILYWKEIRTDPTPIKRYVWVIHAWHVEPYTDGSTATIAYVNPHTGDVYGLDTVSVSVST